MLDYAESLSSQGDPPLEGTSLSSIQAYVKGRVTPSIAFLRAAAHVLDVRETWLISGDGQPTEGDAIAMGPAASGLVTALRRRQQQIERAMEAGAKAKLPLREVFGDSPRPGYAVLLRLWRLRCAQVWPREERLRKEIDIARQIGRASVASLRAMGVDPGDLSDEALEDHLLAVAPILRRIIDEEEQRTREFEALEGGES